MLQNGIIKYVASSEVLFMIHNVHNFLPWGIPWDAGHGVFFGITYTVITVIGIALAYVVLKTVDDVKKSGGSHH